MSIDALIATTKSSGGSSYVFLILIAIFGVAYFFFIRPRQQAARQARDTSKQVDVGDEVVTVGGVHGTVTAVGDEHVTIATGQIPGATPGEGSPTQLTFVKAAIARKVPPTDPFGVDGDAGGGDSNPFGVDSGSSDDEPVDEDGHEK